MAPWSTRFTAVGAMPKMVCQRTACDWSTIPAGSGRANCAPACAAPGNTSRSEEHTSELQSPCNLVCRLLLSKKDTSELQSPCNVVCGIVLLPQSRAADQQSGQVGRPCRRRHRGLRVHAAACAGQCRESPLSDRQGRARRASARPLVEILTKYSACHRPAWRKSDVSHLRFDDAQLGNTRVARRPSNLGSSNSL